ncbi:hypothetical protein [Lignipirellula cremea]|uniref:Uncharacterized protein n=1 Tax=Lignipirellula cremea TaxID=2528010 RepID=A0A518DVI2_9BACT|nr:hypothetical protein [Lignipirellula cremea]QDU95842.1 hypothetical protein Pla8534_36610 [Lignipirellula cremea]
MSVAVAKSFLSLFVPRNREKEAYQELVVTSPYGSLVSMYLGIAIDKGAPRISFGLPPGRELQPSEVEAMQQSHAEIWPECEEDEPAPDPLELAIQKNFDGGFRRRDGLPVLPVWLEIDGQWELEIHGWLMTGFPELAMNLRDRRVALDKSPYAGGKAEWSENTYFLPATPEGERELERAFVRVELVLETNHSITVELLETRPWPSSTPVWWRYGTV